MRAWIMFPRVRSCQDGWICLAIFDVCPKATTPLQHVLVSHERQITYLHPL
jgi:hypothetical protein